MYNFNEIRNEESGKLKTLVCLTTWLMTLALCNFLSSIKNTAPYCWEIPLFLSCVCLVFCFFSRKVILECTFIINRNIETEIRSLFTQKNKILLLEQRLLKCQKRKNDGLLIFGEEAELKEMQRNLGKQLDGYAASLQMLLEAHPDMPKTLIKQLS